MEANDRLEAFAERLAGKPPVRLGEPLSRHTSYHIGGPADALVVARTAEDLRRAVVAAWACELPVTLLGKGSNVLVSDRGVRGVVVENRASQNEFSPANEGTVELYAESGAFLPRLALVTARAGLAGLEWGAAIPGTVGGAVVQNAGAWGGQMAEILLAATIVRRDGVVHALEASELHLGYRTSRFKTIGRALGRGGSLSEVVLGARMRLRQEPAVDVLRRLETFNRQRRESQPAGPSVGSVFKNPPGDHAGRLIEAAGLKGARVGGAQISPRHANFIVNVGGARAADVIQLIELARRRVHEEFGLTLEAECELMGDWDDEGGTEKR